MVIAMAEGRLVCLGAGAIKKRDYLPGFFPVYSQRECKRWFSPDPFDVERGQAGPSLLLL